MSSPMLYNNTTFSNTAMEMSIASNFPQPPRCLSRRAIIYCRLAKQRSEKNTPPKTPKTRYFCPRRISQSFGFSGQNNTLMELTTPSYYQRHHATSQSMERGTSPCDTADHAEDEEEHIPGFRRRSSGRPVNFLAPVHPVTDSDDPPEPGSALTAVPQRDTPSLGWNNLTVRNRHRSSDAGASSGVVVPVIHISPHQPTAGRSNEEEKQAQGSGRSDNNNNSSSIRNNVSNRSTQSEKGMIVVENTDVDVPEGIANVLSPRLAQVANRVYGPFTAELLDLFAVSVRRTILHEAASVSGVLVNQVRVAELFLEPDGSLVFIVTVKPTKPEERDWIQALLLDSTFPSTRVYLKQLRQRNISTPTTTDGYGENWPSPPANHTEESKKMNRKGKRKRKETELVREGKKGVDETDKNDENDDEVLEATPPHEPGLSRGSSTTVGRTTREKGGALKGKKAAAALGKERDANEAEHKHRSVSSSPLSSPSSSVWNSTADGDSRQKREKKKKKERSGRSGRRDRQVSRDALEKSGQGEKEPATPAEVDDEDHPVSEIAADENEGKEVDSLSDADRDTGRKTMEGKKKKNKRNKNKKRSKGKKNHKRQTRREDSSSSADSDMEDDDNKGESEEEGERQSTPSTQVVELSSEDDDDDDGVEMEAKGGKQKHGDRNAEDGLLSSSAASFSSSAVVGRRKKKSSKKRNKKKKNARDKKNKKAKNNEDDVDNEDDNNNENNDLYDSDGEPTQTKKKKKTMHSSDGNAMKKAKKKQKNERRELSSGSSILSASSSPRHRTPPRVQPLDMSELGTGATPLTMRSSRPSFSPSVGRRSTSRSRRLRVIQKPPWVSPLDDPEVKRMVEEQARIEREQALEKAAASATAAMAAATPKQQPQPQTSSVVSTSPQAEPPVSRRIADPHSVSSSPEMQRSAPAPAPAPTSTAFLSTPEPTPREREAPPPPPVQLNRAAVVAGTAVPDAQTKQNRGNNQDPQPGSYGISAGNISESDTSPVREHSFSHAIGDGFLLIDVVYPNTRVSQGGKGGGQAKADRGDVKQLELFFDGTAGTLTGRDVRAYVAEYLGAAPQHIQLRYKEKEVSDGARGAQLGWSNGSLVEAFPPKHLKNAPEQPTISTRLNDGMTINGMRLRQRGLIRTRTPQGWSSDTDFESSGGGSTSSSSSGGVRSPPSPVERRRNQGGRRTPEPAVLQRQLDNRRPPTGDQSGGAGAWGPSSFSSAFAAAATEEDEDEDDIYPQPYRATPTLPTSVIPSPFPPPLASTSPAPSPQRSASRQSTGSAGEVHGISIRPSSTLERRRRLAFGGGAGREDGVTEARHPPAACAGRHQPTLTPPGMGGAGIHRGRDFHSERRLRGDDEEPHPQSLGVRPNPYR